MIVVTGGAGFIGSNIVAALSVAGRGGEVAVCDRLRDGDKWRNLAGCAFADLVHPDALLPWLDGRRDVEAVIHMGAISATTARDGDAVMAANFVLPLRLLDRCAARGIPFLYASSAAVYGAGERGFRDDPEPARIALLRPLNLYGWSKRQFDLLVAERVARGAPMPPRWAGFRFFNVYGPGEEHKGEMRSVVAKILPAVRRGEGVSLFRSHRDGVADGDQRRDFVYVRDAVAAVLWALGPNGRSGIFNVGTGRARSFRDLAAAVFAAAGQPEHIDYVDMPEAIRDKYQYWTEADLNRLRQAGYESPFIGLEDAVAEYVDIYSRDMNNSDSIGIKNEQRSII